MHEQTGRLVLRSWRERSYRLRYGHSSAAAGQHSSHLQTAENSLDDRLWLWLLVSCAALFHSQTWTNTYQHMHRLRPPSGLDLPNLHHQGCDLRESSLCPLEQRRAKRGNHVLLRTDPPQLHDQALPKLLPCKHHQRQRALPIQAKLFPQRI